MAWTSNDPEVQRKLHFRPSIEGDYWRLYITAWVAAICLTAMLCCWMLRHADQRYVHAAGTMILDKHTGKLFDGRFRIPKANPSTD